ncbi:spore germination protein [Ammoniphilus sp. 3BR4]|uniref:spore germination protein n=1 Tax=Ammoniphilus sp. 3BR4 TaxID=3158265 RepID=UPI00346566E6
MKFLKQAIKRIFNAASSPPSRKDGIFNEKQPLHAHLQENIRCIKARVGNSPDIISREIMIGRSTELKAALFFTDGLANNQTIYESIMASLMMLNIDEKDWKQIMQQGNLLTRLKEKVLTNGDIQEVDDLGQLLSSLLSGQTIILVDGHDKALAVSTEGWEDRGVTEASAQTVIRGPREAFSESLRTNTALVRRRIKDPNLWMESQKIGRVTQTNVAIMYVKGIADDKIIDEVRQRLGEIDIDGILESGYIEELIQDETFTPFPTIYNTERPDVIAAGLLEGRIAIFVDGTPFVLLVPALFVQYLQAAEDYYHRSDFGLLRILRYLALGIALFGPSLYVAITTFHQEMLPTPLLISLASQREGVPFPAFIEALMMEVAFEILREAGVRMPRAVGQAVSIVGALVIGQAAVEAGIVSAAMVIVVSITAIANFVLPAFNMAIAIRILRFGFIGLGAAFGLFGILLGIIALLLHLTSLRSFGVPYMSPMAPFNLADQKDAIFRLPQWGLSVRPRLINQRNITRQQSPTSSKRKRG